jgi:hypothetical protein
MVFQKGLDIVKSREENSIVELINKSKKKDDLCDVICQLQAFKVIQFLK